MQFTVDELKIIDNVMLFFLSHNPCPDSLDTLREKVLTLIDGAEEHG